MKIEVGKKYELNNGEVHECTHMRGSDLISVDDFGYGPFVINDILYHQDGRFADADADHEYSVKREWTEPETGTLAELDVKPGDVVECVVAAYNNFTIGKEYKVNDISCIIDNFGNMSAHTISKFRIKPEPVRETVTGWWNGHNFHNKPNYGDRTHRITFTTTDGKPDLDSIKMEALG